VLVRFQRGKSTFLVGTKMIAKELQGPSHLVGIIFADLALSSSGFFRLATDLFIAQAGRGLRLTRDIEGEVVCQAVTRFIGHVNLRGGNDFTAFTNRNTDVREQVKYPRSPRGLVDLCKGPQSKKVNFPADHLKLVLDPQSTVHESNIKPVVA